MPLKGGLHARAFKERKTLKVFDVAREHLYGSPKLTQNHRLRSLFLIPLYVGRHWIGTMSLYMTKDSKFSLLEDSFIFEFAKLAALVLGQRMRQ